MQLQPRDDSPLIDDLYRAGSRAAFSGLAVALGLSVLKFLGGWAGNSLALISDAVHSLGDALASIGILAALHWAQRPADSEHPYGHTRLETAAASSVAILLIVMGLGVGAEVLRTIRAPEPPSKWYAVVIAGISVLASEAIYRYSMAVARRIQSKAVEVSAWDQRLDVFGSLAVLLGLAITTWGGPQWQLVDKLAALVVAAMIVYTGLRLFGSSLAELLDQQAEPELIDAVRATALAVPGVKGVEKLLVRKTGLERLVDIHVEVDPRATVLEGHAIGHAVKDRLIKQLVTVKDVLVHIEPYGQRSNKRVD